MMPNIRLPYELINALEYLKNYYEKMECPERGGYDCDICPIKKACFDNILREIRDSEDGALGGL